MAGQGWTEEEKQYLRNHPDASLQDLSYHLGRSKSSISHQFRHLGINRVFRQTYTEEEIEFLKQNSHVPFNELSAQLGRSIKGLKAKFTADQIQRTEQKQFSDTEIEFVRINRNSMTCQEMADQLGCSIARISGIIHKMQFFREKPNYIQFFDRQCNPRYAYILGWIFADGCLTTSRYRISLKIMEPDALYLKPYMFDVFPHWKIIRIEPSHTHSPQIIFSCSNKEVSNFLSKEWELERKSFGLSNGLYSFINTGGEECRKCFMRGFFEGDGCVPRQKLSSLHIAKRGDFDWSNVSKLLAFSSIQGKIYFSKTSNGSKLLFGRDSAKFAKYIYNTEFDAALPRKKDIALAHFQKPYYSKRYGPLINE